MSGFFADNWIVITFYVGLIILIYLNRSRFEWQGKIVGLLRTNTGLDWMNKWGKKHSKFVRFMGYVGVVAGFLGILLILGFLVWGVYQIFFVPEAPPVLSPVLPGVKVPGSPIVPPLFESIIALFIVILIHEASHGLVAAAHGIKVESSGVFFFGPIPGAFVEPNEKKLVKTKHRVQHSVFAAGPFSNVLSGFIFLGLFIAFVATVSGNLATTGVEIEAISPDSPALEAGLVAGTYTLLEGEELLNAGQILEAIDEREPGDELTFGNAESSYTVVLGEHADDAERAYVGVSGIRTIYALEEGSPIAFWFLKFIETVLYWIFVLSLGLGLANLLPIGPIDGGRMAQLVFRDWLGKKKGDQVWAKSTTLLFVVVIFLVVVPIIRALF